jgi:hypothetical protein
MDNRPLMNLIQTRNPPVNSARRGSARSLGTETWCGIGTPAIVGGDQAASYGRTFGRAAQKVIHSPLGK